MPHISVAFFMIINQSLSFYYIYFSTQIISYRMSDLLQKLEAIHFRFIEVGNLITDPDIIADMKRYVKLNKEYRDLEVLDQIYKTYSNLLSNLKSARELLESETDEEMREMAKMEISELDEAYTKYVTQREKEMNDTKKPKKLGKKKLVSKKK